MNELTTQLKEHERNQVALLRAHSKLLGLRTLYPIERRCSSFEVAKHRPSYERRA